MRSIHLAIVLLLQLLLLVVGQFNGNSVEETPTQSITLDGRVNVGGYVRQRDFRIVVTLDGGQEIVSFCKKDGSFSVPRLPSGTHILDVVASGFHFPQVKLEVSSRGNTGIRAQYAENRQALPIPLDLRGKQISYFERRKPFSLWGFVKSPTGLMICMMLFGIIVFPMLKVDPEEYKQMKEMWNQNGAGQQPQLQGRTKRE